jgi:hypothetical protein
MNKTAANWFARFDISMGIAIAVLITACASGQQRPHDDVRKSVMGKTKADILSCAGTPVQETETERGVILRYYVEAPMFEESGVFLKGSRPGAHRGCWANLLVDKDQVVGAQYNSAPESLEDVTLCDRIFESCRR